jgi:hypothetical protein
MAQPQYEDWMSAQKAPAKSVRQEMEEQYTFQLMTLKLQVEALKAENDKLWKWAVDTIAQERINNRMKELS